MEDTPAIAFELHNFFMVIELVHAEQTAVVTKHVRNGIEELEVAVDPPFHTSVSLPTSADLFEHAENKVAQAHCCSQTLHCHQDDQEVEEHLVVQLAWHLCLVGVQLFYECKRFQVGADANENDDEEWNDGFSCPSHWTSMQGDHLHNHQENGYRNQNLSLVKA